MSERTGPGRPNGTLGGVSVLVAGAGLAGLAAAHDLMIDGAEVTVVDARSRLGGRVWTVRTGFADGQHAEAGGDLIDESQHEIRALADELGLKQSRILPGGFGYALPDGAGKTRIVSRSAGRGWDRLAKTLEHAVRPYRLAEQRWDSPIAADLAHRSVAQWLEEIKADEELRDTLTGLRGFFLADPEELSLLALVDQFASESQQAPWKTYRIDGGNDRLAAAIGARLGDRIKLNTEVVAVSHRGREVRISLKNGRDVSHLTRNYIVFAMPATLLRRTPITPALPAQQHEAIARLKYGRATRTLLQFSKRFWRAPGRQRAFGSPLPFGAVWEGNEEQRGRAGILTLLAGGAASDLTQSMTSKDGTAGLIDSLDWLGARSAQLLGSHQTVWEADPWARGGYAFFDPSYDPALRAWLARPCGRLFFAGEHTSIRWQGYMNGAIESGRRAAAEISAAHRMGNGEK
ncbi:MAG: NAD(P)/FAD-dependent oxidoreductase [Acidobacteriota bacterium]